MRRPITIILAFLLALGAVEGLAYWWMHPKPAGLGEPVLTYRPVGRDPARSAHLSPAARDDKDQTPANAPALSPSTFDSSRHSRQATPDVGSSKFDVPPPSSTTTPLPEIYDQAAPMLRCTSGQVLHTRIDDSLGLHLAFFEWDGADTGSVLEAFRHMPEACMGAIGMKLVSKEKSIVHTVKEQESGNRGQGTGTEDAEDPSSSNQQSPSGNRKSEISSSSPNSESPRIETLVFDHTIFREPGQAGHSLLPGPLVHAFRAVWVSGLSRSDARQGLGGDEFNRLRTIRLKSALTRFRPNHARVIQAAVRGAPNADAAWHAFEQAMLADLTLESK